MIQPDIDRSLNLVHAAMRQAQATQGEIDEILLVGGSTHIPAVRQSMQKLWGDRLLRSLIHPCTAWRWAQRSEPGMASKNRRTPLCMCDMIPRPIGTRSAEGSFLELIPGDTSYPMDSAGDARLQDRHIRAAGDLASALRGRGFPSLNLAGMTTCRRICPPAQM